jgi:hypothetical protein
MLELCFFKSGLEIIFLLDLEFEAKTAIFVDKTIFGKV